MPRCNVCGDWATDNTSREVKYRYGDMFLIQIECQPCAETRNHRDQLRSTELGRKKLEARMD